METLTLSHTCNRRMMNHKSSWATSLSRLRLTFCSAFPALVRRTETSHFAQSCLRSLQMFWEKKREATICCRSGSPSIRSKDLSMRKFWRRKWRSGPCPRATWFTSQTKKMPTLISSIYLTVKEPLRPHTKRMLLKALNCSSKIGQTKSLSSCSLATTSLFKQTRARYKFSCAQKKSMETGPKKLKV